MRVPTRQPRGAARRAEILAAAGELLARSGTAAVTHRQVAERAGVSHGSIRYYFDSRDALLMACLQEIEAERSAEAERALAEAAAEADAPSAEDTARRLIRCLSGASLSDSALRGGLCWLVDTTRESGDLSAELSRERRVLERQAEEILRVSGFPQAPADLAVALGEGIMLKILVEGRTHIAAGATEALGRFLRQYRE
ncbi:TetR/AcrR family transcriptional regulator [Kocuria tytonis]|uniref:TetR/AcrR family transcriptional regulator n=1 Tax=Kocuria tytonis TaxID=2054280 RepID=A0A495A6R1_9MICC|nr:TetR family transcriptional regulator [Kocuria tytonis]RKQ35414.1 TetR/AcrR family transcriptional regulator [Kocuria tytonis]